MSRIQFAELQVVIDCNHPTIQNFEYVDLNLVEKFPLNGTIYLISTSIVKEEYFWFHARYGKQIPRSDTIVDAKTYLEELNPRTKNQFEPSNQLFGLYSISKQTLFLSSIGKKDMVRSYLESILKKDVVIKSFYTSIEEFVKKVKRIDKVRLVAKRDMASESFDFFKIFRTPVDPFGFGISPQFSLDIVVHGMKITTKVIARLKEMVNWQEKGEIKTLVCVGRDDRGFESIFKVRNFVQKVAIDATKDENGVYDEGSVRKSLIAEIDGNKT